MQVPFGDQRHTDVGAYPLAHQLMLEGGQIAQAGQISYDVHPFRPASRLRP